MSVRASVLLGWNPSALDEAADDVESTRRRVESAVGDLERVIAQLGDAWEGDAAAAAAAALCRRRDEGVRVEQTLSMVRRVLRQACDALCVARTELSDARAYARRHGLYVHEDGRVTAPAAPDLSDLDGQALIAATREHQGQLDVAEQAQSMAFAALAAAAEADADAARALRAAWAAAQDGSTLDEADRRLVSAVADRVLPEPGTPPAQVAAWWASLSAGAQARLIAGDPSAVGALNGVPMAARDRANRLVLARELAGCEQRIADLQAQLAAAGPITGRAGPSSPQVQIGAQLAEEYERLRMLSAVNDQLEAGGRDYHLVLFDPAGRGRAAIALGDVDTADHVAVLVPGFSSAVTNYMPIITGNADGLQDQMEQMARVTGSTETVATVAWIGYDAPLDFDVLTRGDAEDGARLLTGLVDGIHASRAVAGSDPHLTIVGHSYGSLVTGIAAAGGPIRADDLVLIGSPGVGVQTAQELGFTDDHIYVGTGDRHSDPIAESGFFSRKLQSDYFGGTQFQTDGGANSWVGGEMAEATGHSEYYRRGTESLWNMAAVVSGHPELVTTIEGDG